MAGYKQVPIYDPARFAAVAIGSSTGGPKLLRQIIASLPADLPFPILIAQHLPLSFTEQLARQLAMQSPLTVVHAQAGMDVLPGVVYLAPGGMHMRVARRPGHKAAIEISHEPAALFYKPSADELFESVANVFGEKSLGLVLSGIGKDGTRGALALKKQGGCVLTQEQASCSVYGMPRSCHEAGLSDASLSPQELTTCLEQFSPQFREQVVQRPPEDQSQTGR